MAPRFLRYPKLRVGSAETGEPLRPRECPGSMGKGRDQNGAWTAAACCRSPKVIQPSALSPGAERLSFFYLFHRHPKAAPPQEEQRA